MSNKEKTYKKPLGQLKLEKFCSDNNNLIQNYISYLYKNSNYKIKLMTNDDDIKNRYTHCGAHICVETEASRDYYYITTSRKDYYCQNYLTINVNLLDKIKQATFNYKILLFNGGKIYRFDKWALDNIEKNENGFVNVPLDEAEDVYFYSKDDFHTPKKYIKIEWDKLGWVRYSDKFDMHKKPIAICTEYIGWKRREYDSIVKAYAALTGTKVKNNKVIGKPVLNAAYKKSYVTFRREIKTGSLTLINENGETFKAAILFPVATPGVTEAPAEVTTSILVAEYNLTTNIDVVTSDNENCNNEKTGGQRRLDKQLDNIAEKLVEKETTKYTPAEIQKTIISYGSNKHMLKAYTESLTEKGLQKEAAYAAKIFEALNNIDFN